jgi:hypothetical protein
VRGIEECLSLFPFGAACWMLFLFQFCFEGIEERLDSRLTHWVLQVLVSR